MANNQKLNMFSQLIYRYKISIAILIAITIAISYLYQKLPIIYKPILTPLSINSAGTKLCGEKDPNCYGLYAMYRKASLEAAEDGKSTESEKYKAPNIQITDDKKIKLVKDAGKKVEKATNGKVKVTVTLSEGDNANSKVDTDGNIIYTNGKIYTPTIELAGSSCQGQSSLIGDGQWAQSGKGLTDDGKVCDGTNKCSTSRRLCVRCVGGAFDLNNAQECGTGDASNYITRPYEVGDCTDPNNQNQLCNRVHQSCWVDGVWYSDNSVSGENLCIEGKWVESNNADKIKELCEASGRKYFSNLDACQISIQDNCTDNQVFNPNNNTCEDKNPPTCQGNQILNDEKDECIDPQKTITPNISSEFLCQEKGGVIINGQCVEKSCKSGVTQRLGDRFATTDCDTYGNLSYIFYWKLDNDKYQLRYLDEPWAPHNPVKAIDGKCPHGTDTSISNADACYPALATLNNNNIYTPTQSNAIKDNPNQDTTILTLEAGNFPRYEYRADCLKENSDRDGKCTFGLFNGGIFSPTKFVPKMDTSEIHTMKNGQSVNFVLFKDPNGKWYNSSTCDPESENGSSTNNCLSGYCDPGYICLENPNPKLSKEAKSPVDNFPKPVVLSGFPKYKSNEDCLKQHPEAYAECNWRLLKWSYTYEPISKLKYMPIVTDASNDKSEWSYYVIYESPEGTWYNSSTCDQTAPRGSMTNKCMGKCQGNICVNGN